MDSTHNSFPNPTIREVVCEIHFALPQDQSWDTSWYSKFFRQVEDEFPTFQPVVLPMLIGPADDQGGLSFPQLIRYHHKSRGVLLQLSDSRLSINVLPIYPGWDAVIQDIVYAWEHLKAVVNISSVHRIGLRYINGIPRQKADEMLNEWINPSPYFPHAILFSKPNFNSTALIQIDDSNRLKVTVGDQNEGSGLFIFDIDRIFDGTISGEKVAIMEKVDTLHKDVWDVFQQTISDRLMNLLKGQLV